MWHSSAVVVAGAAGWLGVVGRGADGEAVLGGA